MYGFLCKRLVHNAKLVGNPTQNQLGFLPYISLSTKSFSSSSVKNEQQQSFRVSYLMNSCGLSLEDAITASKQVYFETLDKPDSVLKLFQNHGFSNAQIAKLVRIKPKFLTANPENSLLPKLEFFHSIGISPTLLPTIVSSHPSLLGYSLDNHLIPTFEFIKSFIVADDKVAMVLKNTPTMFQENVQKRLAPNISFLRDHGVPASSISFLLTRYGIVLLYPRDKFEKSVKQVIEMGFNSSALAFVLAVRAIARIPKSTWNHKMEVYRRWGWSETEFRAAFRINPVIMDVSEMKITRAMEFFVNKMGLKSAVLSRKPVLLALSLEKRIIPRCSVIKVLRLKENSVLRHGQSSISFYEICLKFMVIRFRGDKENERGAYCKPFYFILIHSYPE